jgi:hypothetical protein
MRHGEKIPWNKLHDYLLDLSSCHNRRELLHAACVELMSIIPFDGTAGAFDSSDGRNIDGIGKTEECTAVYNNYYRKLLPRSLPSIVDWRKLDSLEIAADFLLPNGMYKSLRCVKSGCPIYMIINRSRLAPGFTDAEVEALDLIHAYVNDLYTAFGRTNDAPGRLAPWAEAIVDYFPSLSLREAEVCAMVARRLTTPEIAAGLFISPRTVEKHVENIFEKLEVRSRGQLRWRIGALSFVRLGDTAMEPVS